MRNCKLKYTATLLILAALPAAGSDTADWKSIEALRPGTRIGVVQTNRKRVEGRFAGVTGQGISLEAAGVISIPKEEVIRVYGIGMSRTKRMLVGGAIGLGAGAAVAVGVSRRLNNEGFFSGSNGEAGAAAAVAGGAGIGIAAGSLTGSGYRTIYQKEGER